MTSDPRCSLFMRLGASRHLVYLFGVLYLGAVACAFTNNLPLVVQSLLACGLLQSAWRTISLHGTRRAARAIVVLSWDRHGQWRLVQRDGAVLDAHLEPGAYAHPRLTVLPFRSRSGARLSVLLTAGMVDSESLRRLRARLRCEPPREL